MMPLVSYVSCVLLIVVCGSVGINGGCMPDIMIGSNIEKQVLRTDKPDTIFYARHQNMTHIDVALQFTFGEETLRFPIENCIRESSCFQEVQVRAVRDSNGMKPSKWAVELSVGPCLLRDTYSHLYWLNNLNSLSILADGPSEFYTTGTSFECLGQLNSSHCPSPRSFIKREAPEVMTMHTGIIAAFIAVPVVAILIGFFLFRRIKTLSESTLELASVVSTGNTSDITSFYAPSLPEERSIYLLPNPSFRTNSCPPFPSRPCPLIPEALETSSKAPSGDDDHLYAEAMWISCGAGACGGRPVDSLKGECGVGQDADVNKDTQNHYEVCD